MIEKTTSAVLVLCIAGHWKAPELMELSAASGDQAGSPSSRVKVQKINTAWKTPGTHGTVQVQLK